MQKKLTITLDETVYAGLYPVIGRRRISGFIQALVSPHVITPNHAQAHAEMAADETWEAEALEWAEGTVEDVADAAR